MAPEQAAAIAVSHIHEDEVDYGRELAPIRIVSVTAIPANRINEVLPQDGAPLDTSEVVWVVRAEGTFVASRMVRGESELRTSTTGQYVIWDRDGTLDGWGFP